MHQADLKLKLTHKILAPHHSGQNLEKFGENIPEIWSPDEKVDPLTVLRTAAEPAQLWMTLEQQVREKLITPGFIDRQARDVWSGTGNKRGWRRPAAGE